MAGLGPAIPTSGARRSSDRDHRHKAGDHIAAATRAESTLSDSL
jgi:hypothetical protein